MHMRCAHRSYETSHRSRLSLVACSSGLLLTALGCGSGNKGASYKFDAGIPPFNPGSGTGSSSVTGSSSTVGGSSTAGSNSTPGSSSAASSSTAPPPLGDGGVITCPAPGNYTKNGGACGTERWDIKTGTDPYTGSVSLVPKPNTIATLAALPAAGGGTQRESPTEVTLWQLTDVTLTELQDGVRQRLPPRHRRRLRDHDRTIPYPSCAAASPWICFITRARSEIDSKYTVGTSPQNPAATITVRGVGFFDYKHGQTGVAPNAIELHPVLQICFGKGCTPT